MSRRLDYSNREQRDLQLRRMPLAREPDPWTKPVVAALILIVVFFVWQFSR